MHCKVTKVINFFVLQELLTAHHEVLSKFAGYLLQAM
jgi:hypothetical protein